MSLANIYRLLSRTFRKSFDRLYSSHFRRYKSYLFKVMFACSMLRSYTAATPRWQVIDSGRCWWAGWDGDDPRNNRFAVGRTSESHSVVQNALLLQKVIVRRAPCSKGACYNIVRSSQKGRVVTRTFTSFSQTIRRGPCRGYTSEEDAFSVSNFYLQLTVRGFSNPIVVHYTRPLDPSSSKRSPPLIAAAIAVF